jgi:hypothetical protein
MQNFEVHHAESAYQQMLLSDRRFNIYIYDDGSSSSFCPAWLLHLCIARIQVQLDDLGVYGSLNIFPGPLLKVIIILATTVSYIAVVLESVKQNSGRFKKSSGRCKNISVMQL